ncbi:MAG: hypothetical protein LBV04_00445 [Deferribacteraceae bacterium]|jgi:hypothetical protein|nr:hypothetical protein [Deferribacteraceae bacterium]
MNKRVNMHIEDLETQLIKLLKDSGQFKSVKRYAGELERDGLLRSTAGNIPAAMVFTAGIEDSLGKEDCIGIDQLPAETLTLMVILMVSADPEHSRFHELRRLVRNTLDGFDAEGELPLPLVNVKTDALAITATVSVYAMQYNCEIYS